MSTYTVNQNITYQFGPPCYIYTPVNYFLNQPASATLASAVSNSTALTITSSNSAILPGMFIGFNGVVGTVYVASISGTNITASSAVTYSASTALTF